MDDFAKLLAVYPAPWTVVKSESHRDKWVLHDGNDEYVGTFEDPKIVEHIAMLFNAWTISQRN